MSIGHLHFGLWLCALACLCGGNTNNIRTFGENTGIKLLILFGQMLLGYLLYYLIMTLLDSVWIVPLWFHQCDILGDESRPSLHDLLLQPVQRIPEYLLLLQVRSKPEPIEKCAFPFHTK